jgi:transposase
LPEAYVAPRELRDLLRQRVELTQMRTGAEEPYGRAARAPRPPPRSVQAVRQQGKGAFVEQAELREPTRQRLGVLLRLIQDFDLEIDALADKIDTRAKADPRVRLLCHIKGIGRYTAMLVIAEVGEIERFHSARHPCAWAG